MWARTEKQKSSAVVVSNSRKANRERAVGSLSGVCVVASVSCGSHRASDLCSCEQLTPDSETETICCQVQGRASWELSSHCPWSCWLPASSLQGFIPLNVALLIQVKVAHLVLTPKMSFLLGLCFRITSSIFTVWLIVIILRNIMPGEEQARLQKAPNPFDNANLSGRQAWGQSSPSWGTLGCNETKNCRQTGRNTC